MKLKKCSKYKDFIILSGCIFSLFFSYHYITNIHMGIADSSKAHKSFDKQPVSEITSNKANENHNRIIIVPSERTFTPDKNMTDTTNKTRVLIPATEDAFKVKPLPPADNSSPIIVNLLTSN